MKKVVTINLNGRAYQVEEDGYIQLSRYLETAQKKLDKNPDKEEILADIEQAIADKCDGELGAGKNVVTITAVDRVLEKVGVIQGDVDTDDETGDEDTGGYEVKRKLYRLPSKGRLFGVCAGVGAYFGTDTTIIRLLFILLTLLTNGFMILVYILLAVVMPEAKNS
ncbi:PspC domain-containing protein, partial [Candidatus Saccharibacteria bacterium]|nr:PspC domain-containing protein [Candidatus Saccharibacteria bacterium]